MSQVGMHEPDSGSFDKKLETINLALKSIAAHELSQFNKLNNSINNNNARIVSITDSTRRLTNLVNNLTYAAMKLVELEKNAYIFVGKATQYNSLATQWMTDTGYKY